MQILDGEREIFGEGTVAVDDAQCCAIGAMCGHATLAIPAIRLVAGSVNVTYYTFSGQMSIAFPGVIAVDFFYDTNKFMAEYPLKAHIASYDLQIGVTDTNT